MWNEEANVLSTAPVNSSVPPLAVIVPTPSTGPDTVPLPLSVAPLPIVIPAESVRVPPPSTILPLVTLSAAVMVRLPVAPISSVWLVLLIEIAPDVAVPSIFKSEFAAFVICSVRPLTVPARDSVPALAVIVPALEIGMLTVPEPVMLVFAARVPRPLIVPPSSVMPLASVSKDEAPSSRIWPLVIVCAPLIVRLPLVPTSSVWLALVIEIAVAAIAVLENFRVDADALAIVNTGPLATVPVRFSRPPLAVTVPAPAAIFAAIVPKPVSVAPLPIVKPDASVSVPPSSWILPLVMLSAALIVRLPLAPISSVWAALLIAIAPVVAVLENFSVEADPVAIVNVGPPLATVPVRFSTPPLAVTAPVPAAILAATVPNPVSVAPVPIVKPAASV